MSAGYVGMRWLKCDLHMHTFVDSRHWRGDAIIPGQEMDAAVSFAEACYQARLDVVGITDHNFLSKDFLPFLYKAFEDIEKRYLHKVTIFPGFEFEAAGVGKGVHVLGLFDPQSDLNLIDNILTECGIAYPRVDEGGVLEKSDKNLKEIIHIIQDKHKGLVILPHSMSNDGIFDNDSFADWLQKDQFTYPHLLAVEVPKPVCRMSDNFKRLFSNGNECHPEWKRIRPIATLMSSDCKQLLAVDESKKPLPNSINYRFSWIKMSHPSIVSLRQSFLDQESRIELPQDILSDYSSSVYPQIKSIKVRNVPFLANQDVFFSPNMNCIIGGRGSGKSTLLEYIRILMQKDNETLDQGTVDRINRVKSTLSASEVEIEVCWQGIDGMEDQILLKDGKITVVNRQLTDSDTYFKNLPIQFYSQQQLNKLTESKSRDGNVRQAEQLLELIDGFAGRELKELFDKERKLKRDIHDAYSDLHRIESLYKDLRRLQQEYQDLERLWMARSEIQQDIDTHQLLMAESEYLNQVFGPPGKQFSDVVDLAELVADSHVHYSVTCSPHEEWFKQFDSVIETAKDELVDTIRDAVDRFTHNIDERLKNDPLWGEIKSEIDQADAAFKEACATKGLSPDDVERLHDVKVACDRKSEEIEEIGMQISQLKDERGNPEELMNKLHQIWKDQFEMRHSASTVANELARAENASQQFVDVTASYQRNYEHFCKLWQDFAPSDRRTRLGRNWDQIGDALYLHFTGEEKCASPWQLLYDCLADVSSANDALVDFIPDLNHYITENHEAWEKLCCSRVEDVVDMKLFRSDGTYAGSIAEGTLSDGQRNTAALVLLLAQEGGPLIIDQPEDELDSNFVYYELMPMLRKVKPKRQLIFATHNANLPVNGDAEIVYALEARNGRGEVLAQGGLDQDSVTRAILDIMEGSAEAFRRRREKYNF